MRSWLRRHIWDFHPIAVVLLLELATAAGDWTVRTAKGFVALVGCVVVLIYLLIFPLPSKRKLPPVIEGVKSVYVASTFSTTVDLTLIGDHGISGMLIPLETAQHLRDQLMALGPLGDGAPADAQT